MKLKTLAISTLAASFMLAFTVSSNAGVIEKAKKSYHLTKKRREVIKIMNQVVANFDHKQRLATRAFAREEKEKKRSFEAGLKEEIRVFYRQKHGSEERMEFRKKQVKSRRAFKEAQDKRKKDFYDKRRADKKAFRHQLQEEKKTVIRFQELDEFEPFKEKFRKKYAEYLDGGKKPETSKKESKEESEEK